MQPKFIMKTCNKCNETKPTESFYKHSSTKDGFTTYCKKCLDLKNKKWAANNPEKNLRIKQKYLEQNKSKRLESVMKWQTKNQHKRNANEASRRAAMAASVKLSSDQRKSIESLYILAKSLSIELGIAFHVDHIVPLKGRNVCGLHVPWNLRIVPASVNLKKSNKLIEGI